MHNAHTHIHMHMQKFNQPAGAAPNGFAYYREKDIMIWAYTNSTNGGPLGGMYYWLRNTNQYAKFAEPCAIGWRGTETNALPACPNEVTSVLPADATIYDGAYWYIPKRRSGQSDPCQLTKAPLLFDANGIPSGFGPYTVYPLSGCPDPLEFGDIAADPKTGILYATTSTPLGYFATINLRTLQTGTPNAWTTVLSTPPNPSLQIAFDCDYNTLYGVEYGNGAWYTMNTADGAATPIGWAPNPNGPRDLAGGSCNALPPGDDPEACKDVTVKFIKAPKKVRAGKKFSVAFSLKLQKGATLPLPVNGSATLALAVAPPLSLVQSKPSGTYNQSTSTVSWPLDSLLAGHNGRKPRRSAWVSATLRIDGSVAGGTSNLPLIFYIINGDGTLECFTQIQVKVSSSGGGFSVWGFLR